MGRGDGRPERSVGPGVKMGEEWGTVRAGIGKMCKDGTH